MIQVDLNSDLGESFGNYKIGLDESVIQFVSSANIACGWHGGDPLVMQETVAMAKVQGVGIGAHPGYPDLMGFGRRNMTVTPKEIKAYVQYQLGALMAFVMSIGEKIQHVKPHGAMYNMAAKDYSLAKGIAEAIYAVDKDIILLGLANSEMIRAGEAVGLKVASEVFADRAYNADGTLVARTLPGAVIHDTDLAIARVVRMVKEGKVTAITGEDVAINAQSICVHGDNPEAVAFVKQIRKALEDEGILISKLGNFIR
ncbi:LamB/YcsF family protein [Geosporobacter ferrireducens]|uniref:5-oxoprolinase subunit A n=1 Tax=Geosporobacter ferrireducens TaxID=1424294 RepID=A0A1D8GHY1_9FIRM|nr:5-oxoprolinase subunit PxpA [Geosporobacter ferrireducens]AOT70504.1 lactam utilization protein LamB [Geosporobacter ferrireducens]MTI57143.1 LamB/YcsF family protein [Geosporobacter ferrireducens]